MITKEEFRKNFRQEEEVKPMTWESLTNPTGKNKKNCLACWRPFIPRKTFHSFCWDCYRKRYYQRDTNDDD